MSQARLPAWRRPLTDEERSTLSTFFRGTLAKEGAFTPDRVAEALWSAVSTADADWRSEVPYSG